MGPRFPAGTELPQGRKGFQTKAPPLRRKRPQNPCLLILPYHTRRILSMWRHSGGTKIDDGESATPTSLATNGDAGTQTPSSIVTISVPLNSVNAAEGIEPVPVNKPLPHRGNAPMSTAKKNPPQSSAEHEHGQKRPVPAAYARSAA